MLIQSGYSQPGPTKKANVMMEHFSSKWMTRRQVDGCDYPETLHTKLH